MPVNKNALIRYKTIDKCLQNKYRKWTLDDLIDACSDALYEYEGKDTNVSKRTIQLDIFNMRSEKLGYNAPIIVVDRKYYTYEDENYSITNLPISSFDLEKLAESVTFLKQFKGFSHFDELYGVIQKLEDHVYSKQTHTKPVIEFEKNEHLKGLQFLDELYQNIINKRCVNITYKSFKARQAANFDFHAYLLKEYRNRWFVIGIRNKQKHIVNLALDRIISLGISQIEYKENLTYNLEEYYSKTIGVSVNPDLKTEEIILFVYNKHAPYVITKPFHPSQKVIAKNVFGITISLDIQHNFELEKEILGLGDGIKVIAPNALKRNIKSRLDYALNTYQTEISSKRLSTISKQLQYKGSSILNQVYSLRELKLIFKAIYNFVKEEKKTYKLIVNCIEKIPLLESLLLNDNLKKIVDTVSKKAILKNSVYYKEKPKNIISKEWFQNKEKNQFLIRIHLRETNPYNYLSVILGSQRKLFNKTEMDLIVENSVPFEINVRRGGIHLLNNNIIKKWNSKINNTGAEIIELTYTY